MRSIKRGCIAIVVICQVGCASAQPGLIGDWQHIGTEGSSNVVECPDVLTFREDGVYFVQNDCYGNSRQPIVEHGCWSSSDGEHRITLTKRNFETNYRFLKDSEIVALNVSSELGSEVVLQTAEAVERYRKVDARLNTNGLSLDRCAESDPEK